MDALLKVDANNAAALAMLREIEVEEARRRKKRTGVGVKAKPTFRFSLATAPCRPIPHKLVFKWFWVVQKNVRCKSGG